MPNGSLSIHKIGLIVAHLQSLAGKFPPSISDGSVVEMELSGGSLGEKGLLLTKA